MSALFPHHGFWVLRNGIELDPRALGQKAADGHVMPRRTGQHPWPVPIIMVVALIIQNMQRPVRKLVSKHSCAHKGCYHFRIAIEQFYRNTDISQGKGPKGKAIHGSLDLTIEPLRLAKTPAITN